MEEIKFSDIELLDVGSTIFLTGSIWSGNGKSYLCLFPEQELEKEISVLKMTLEEWGKFIRQSDILETEILEHGPDKVTKAIIRKSQRLIDARVAWKVYRRDNYHCRYCGNNGVPLTVDHLMLWEDGGPTVERNLLTSCRKCNKKRGKTQYSDWLNSEYYKRVSENLSDEIKKENQNIVLLLDTIDKVNNIRSR